MIRRFAELGSDIANVPVSVAFVATNQGHSDFKSMPSVGVGAYEIRVKSNGHWRVIYVAKQADAVYVLHCFQKATPKTSKPDIDLAVKRFKLIGV